MEIVETTLPGSGFDALIRSHRAGDVVVVTVGGLVFVQWSTDDLPTRDLFLVAGHHSDLDGKTFLKSKYGLDSETIRLRRAYYSAERIEGDGVQAAPFDPDLGYGLTSWEGPLANEVAARGGCLQLRLESPSQDCRLLLSFSPETEVALPCNARVVCAHVYLRGSGAGGVHHAVELEQLGVTRSLAVGHVRLEGPSLTRLGDVLREQVQ